MSRFFSNLARWSARHSRLVLGMMLGSFLLAAWGASRLEFRSNVSHLLPSRARATHDLLQAAERFGTMDMLLVALEVEGEGPVLPYRPFARILAEELRKAPTIESVQEGVGEELRRYVEEVLAKRAFLFLNPKEMNELEARLDDEGIRAAVGRLRAKLLLPLGGPLTRDLLTLDPLDLLALFVRRLPRFEGATQLDFTSGALLSSEGTLMLLIAKPRGTAQDISFDERLFKDLREAETRARALAESTAALPPETALSRLQVQYAGGHMLALSDARLIRSDIGLNFLTSFAGVLILFFLFFRRLTPLAIAMTPITLGLAWTLGLSKLVTGRLSEVTGAFAAILVGLAVDDGIVLCNRYLDERARGLSVEDALAVTLGGSGPSIVTSAATTIASFAALLLSTFPGIGEMGALVASGIALCLVANMVGFPALIMTWERRRERRSGRTSPPKPLGRMRSMGLERLANASARRPVIALAAVALATVALAASARHLTFDKDPRSLRPARNPGYTRLDRIMKKIGASEDVLIVLVQGKTEAEALEANDEVDRALGELGGEFKIRAVESASGFLPSPPRQQATASRLAASTVSGAPLDPERIDRTFLQALEANDLRPEPFARFRSGLRDALASREPVTSADLSAAGMGLALQRFLAHSPASGREAASEHVATYVHIDRDRWTDDDLRRFEPRLRSFVPTAHVTGSPRVLVEIMDLVVHDSTVSTLVSLAANLLLLGIAFRSIRHAATAFIPMALGIVWMFGTMVLAGIQLNFMNLVVLTILLGVGTDYGIYMLYRYREGDADAERAMLDQTSKAVVLAALTNIAGFGSVAVSHYPGLASMGIVSVIGTFACLLLSLVLVPALLFADRSIKR